MNAFIFLLFVALIFGVLWYTGKLDGITASLGAGGVAIVSKFNEVWAYLSGLGS